MIALTAPRIEMSIRTGKTDGKPYQCDIYHEGEDHHGIGENIAEALVAASQAWAIHEFKKLKEECGF